MDTKGSNKLIAEFMGHTIDIENQDGLFRLNSCMDAIESEINYHNWSDVHKVLDKIQSIYETDDVFGALLDICTTHVRISIVDEDFNETIDLKGDNPLTKLQAMYKIVVEFIEWYNDNKPLNNNQILGQSTII